jgi:pilus assembly protein Flp/PilA
MSGDQPFSGFPVGAPVPDSMPYASTTGEEVSFRMLINLYNRLRYRDEEGQALVEYALILGLVAVVAIGALTTLGTNVTAVLSQIAAAIPGA